MNSLLHKMSNLHISKKRSVSMDMDKSSDCMICKKEYICEDGEKVCNDCLSLVCEKCEGNYKCDTGFGENRIRVKMFGKCPVCDSDPNGEHQEWFECYLGYDVCEDCGVLHQGGNKCEDCEDYVF